MFLHESCKFGSMYIHFYRNRFQEIFLGYSCSRVHLCKFDLKVDACPWCHGSRETVRTNEQVLYNIWRYQLCRLTRFLTPLLQMLLRLTCFSLLSGCINTGHNSGVHFQLWICLAPQDDVCFLISERIDRRFIWKMKFRNTIFIRFIDLLGFCHEKVFEKEAI